MSPLDLVVFALYIAGLLVMGSVFVKRTKTTREMFAAGGQSPWWLSGMSAFMTMFSAGTFVIWGGIAYRLGLVAVSICMTLGISALLVGFFLAGIWKKSGVDSAAEFLELRFGRSIVQFYTWLQGTVGIFTMGGSVYALAVIVCALIPLPANHLLADPATGHLSVSLASIGLCCVVVAIAFGGGLWAVLMTDVLQFIILTVAVLLVVPLILIRAGGWGAFIHAAPEGFFRPVADDFTWWFLAGWVLVHFFKIGGEWAYVQRSTCVPTPGDARKASLLFGALYLISPVIWMAPPMIYRVMNPDADPEQAYVLACQAVLPAGLIGLMIAAMSSATASMVTTQLNVYAGALTTEFYRSVLRPTATERELVRAGRVITIFLGGVVVAGALLIPRMGSYTGYILATTALLSGPLVLPTIWGLFSKRIGLGTAWSVTGIGMLAGLFTRYGLTEGGWLSDIVGLAPIREFLSLNLRVTEIAVGTGFPLLLLAAAELLIHETNPGWHRVVARRKSVIELKSSAASTLPARLCGWSVTVIAAVIVGLGILDPTERAVLMIFAMTLGLVGCGILVLTRNKETPIGS